MPVLTITRILGGGRDEKRARPSRPAGAATTTEVAPRYEDDLAPAIDRVWENGVAAIRADLREWLRRDSEDDSGLARRRLPRRYTSELGPPSHRLRT